jgi:opacity protein-like surface antigen
MNKLFPSLIFHLIIVLNIFGKGDLGRTKVVTNIGFAKINTESDGIDLGDSNGLALGLEGNFAIINDPALFGFDIGAGYNFNKSDYKLRSPYYFSPQSVDFTNHEVWINANPYLHINQYLKPYLSLGIGLSNSKTKPNIYLGDSDIDVGVDYEFGIGLETEIYENWSSHIGYGISFDDDDDVDTGILTLGTGYWFNNGLGFGFEYQYSSLYFTPYSLFEVELRAHEFGFNFGFSF